MSAAVAFLGLAVSTLTKRSGSLEKRDVYDDFRRPGLLGGDPLDGAPPDVGPAMMTVLAGLLIGVFIALTLINYTINLLLTLTIVEDPPAVYLPLSTDARLVDTQSKRPPPREFVTSSIHGSLKHLRSVGGKLAPWRGLGASIALMVVTSAVRGFSFLVLTAAFVPTDLASFVASIWAAMLTARFNMVVTHIRLTSPSPLSWYARVRAVPWAAARPTLPALLAYSTAVAVAGELAVFAARPEFEAQTRGILACVNLGFCVLVVLPLYVVLVRVQASTVPVEAETVVVFDRSFGVADDEGKMSMAAVAKGVYQSGAGRRVTVFLMKTVSVYAVLMGVLVGGWMAVAVGCGAKFGMGN